MSVQRAFAGEERQRVTVGLGDRLILREVDHLAPTVFITSHNPIIVPAQPVSAVT